jgi:hypothetical protein
MPRPAKPASNPSPQTKRLPRRASKANEKSKYFEPPSDDDEQDSSFDDKDGEQSSSDSASVTSETDLDEPVRKKAKTTPRKAVSPKAPKKGTPRKKKEEEEEPWETFIPKEATPEAGDVDYQDDRIHPNTLKFLKGFPLCTWVDG